VSLRRIRDSGGAASLAEIVEILGVKSSRVRFLKCPMLRVVTFAAEHPNVVDLLEAEGVVVEMVAVQRGVIAAGRFTLPIAQGESAVTQILPV
jgi:hypothetical protein